MANPRVASNLATDGDAAQDAKLDAEAELEIENGLGVSHERVRDWLMKLANGERSPPPKA